MFDVSVNAGASYMTLPETLSPFHFSLFCPIAERDAVLAQQSAAAKAVDDFNGSAPSIQGIMLQHDGLGV